MMNMMNRWIVFALLLLCVAPFARAENTTSQPQQGSSVQVMEDFQKQQEEQAASKALSDREKHRIMFYLGIPLLLLLLITAGLGIAMVLYGKQVFKAHMIFAALAITLSIAHVIAGLVWFYPF